MKLNLESKKHSEHFKNITESNFVTLFHVIRHTNESSVVYVISDPNDDEVIYVGETCNFSKRMIQHCGSNGFLNFIKNYNERLCYNVRHIYMNDISNRKCLESYIVSILNPKYNKTRSRI